MKPVLQLALDFLELNRALKAAEEAVRGGADWIEAGTPLIKSVGLGIIRKLRKKFTKHTIVADMKTIDAGRIEVEAAAKAGADIVIILGSAPDSTIRECIEAAHIYGTEICADLLEVPNPKERAQQLEKLGVNYIGVHTSIDEQMEAKEPFQIVKEVASVVNIPVAVAGGINSETAWKAIQSGASIVIVGGAIIKSADAYQATKAIKEAITKQKVIKSRLYKRVSEKQIREILTKVSTPNISDAMHRKGDIKEVFPITPGAKMVGPAVTVRTYPGDFAKPVEAIDEAQKGEVIVIDAGGASPAVWGELATESCVQKGIAGVVIYGAIRDVPEIRKLGFPAFAKIITPTAGEPRGLGEIGVPIFISGVEICPGDWVVGDDDGVVVIPKTRAVEFTNRAMDVLERENRIRQEIHEGATLSKVTELLRWEKQLK